MAPERDVAAAGPVPTPFRTLHRDAVNALAWLQPLTALASSLGEAAAVEDAVAVANEHLATVNAQVTQARADLDAANREAEAAEAAARQRMEESRAEAARVREETKVQVSEARAERDRQLQALADEVHTATVAKAADLEALDRTLRLKQGEVTRAERLLAETKAAHEAFTRLAATPGA